MLEENWNRVNTTRAPASARRAAPWLAVCGLLLLAGCQTTVTRDNGLPTEPLTNSDKPKQHAYKKQEPGSGWKFASKDERKVQRMKEKANVW